MPTPGMSAERLRQVYDCVASHGELRGAAEELGLGYSATGEAYRRAMRELGLPEARRSERAIRAMGAAPSARKSEQFTRPTLPPKGESMDEWLDRRSAEFVRRKTYDDAKTWMRFTINQPGPFGLVFVGDPHADDNGADLPALRRDLKLIADNPHLYGVGLGDWINSWTRRLGHLYGQQSSSESEAWRVAEWMLSQDIWMLLLGGNHDLWHGAASPLRWMATRAPLEDWQCRFEVAVGDVSWRIWAAHDFPGSSIWNPLHGPMRRAQMGLQADLYVCGHRHCYGLAEHQDQHTGSSYYAARARGYKALDSYSRQLGFGEAGDLGQSITAVCDPQKRRMKCFSDVEEASEHLEWLRAKQGYST